MPEAFFFIPALLKSKSKGVAVMKRKLWLMAMVAAVLLSAAPVLAQEFYVVAGGGPPVGTKITSLPYNINSNSPGFYYLTGNLSAASGSGITVNSNYVTIDLMGFNLNGNNLYDGININGSNVEVRNGSLSGWSNGIHAYSGNNQIRVINVGALNCINSGILLQGAVNLVKDCSVNGNFDCVLGISTNGATVKGNQVEACSTGIYSWLGTTSDNTVSDCTDGIMGSGTISNNSITGNANTGVSSTGIKIDGDLGCLVSGNHVDSCTDCGINAFGTISNNTVILPASGGTGINCGGTGSIIGNSVITQGSGQIGIWVADVNLLTGNSVSGPGIRFSGGTGNTVKVNNAGF
jgi:hypothetical protein